MITRRAFIASMKKNGYTYDPKQGLLHRGEFDGSDKMEVLVWLKQGGFKGKEYCNLRVQEKNHSEYAGVVMFGRHDLVPYDHVMVLLSLIKDIRSWWAA